VATPVSSGRRAALAALATLAALLMPAPVVSAQAGTGATVTPYAGYLVTGRWFDGPVGTSLTTTNAPMVGGQGTIPLARGLALVGNLAYASGELRVGLPVLGGVNVGSARTWLYDAGLELGGLAGRSVGIAPFVQGGVGGLTSDIRNRLFDVRASNLAWTAGVGVDVGLAPGFALRVQAKDWIGRFDAEEAVGVPARGNLAHNWALTAGVRLAF
jgi:hypothetical protein